MTHTIKFEFSAKLDRGTFETALHQWTVGTCTFEFIQTDSNHHKYQLTSEYPQDFAYIGMKMGRYGALHETRSIGKDSLEVIKSLEQQVANLKTKLELAKQACKAISECNDQVLNILLDHNQKPHQAE